MLRVAWGSGSVWWHDGRIERVVQARVMRSRVSWWMACGEGNQWRTMPMRRSGGCCGEDGTKQAVSMVGDASM